MFQSVLSLIVFWYELPVSKITTAVSYTHLDVYKRQLDMLSIMLPVYLANTYKTYLSYTETVTTKERRMRY